MWESNQQNGRVQHYASRAVWKLGPSSCLTLHSLDLVVRKSRFNSVSAFGKFRELEDISIQCPRCFPICSCPLPAQ
jgi:hypothetical protein